MDSSIRFLILVLLGLVLGGSAQALSTDELLDQTETNVLELVKQVQANALNSCDLLSSCNDESTCSRLSCPLTNADTTGYECIGVLRNTDCKDDCPQRNFDFSRSFLSKTVAALTLAKALAEEMKGNAEGGLGALMNVLRLVGQRGAPEALTWPFFRCHCQGHCCYSVPRVNAKTINSTTQRQLQEICAQRNLNSFFQKHSNNTYFFSLYFGSVDGTSRFFPGLEESDCGTYDPRTRLWYLTSTTNVKKAVMVLIDSGSSMTETIGSTRTDSNLATAFNITESFLNTTTKDDYVNILTFDRTNVNFSSDQPVLVTDTSSHPDFENFFATLSAPNQSPNPPGNGNITDAISEVIISSAGFNNTNISSDYLKVIILITDSNEQAVDAINNVALPWDLIKNNSINLFLYMIPPSILPIDTSPLASQLCAARGYFEILDDTVFLNPLLALEAYYSFVANVHATYVNRGIDYTTEYSDSSDVDNRTFTLSKAVFSNNGELLGVAAIDIFKTKVQEVYGIDGDAFELAVRNRANHTFNFYTSSTINTTTCFNQTPNKTCNQIANISNIVCSSTFGADTTTLRKLSCCGTCAGGDNKPRNLPLTLGLGLGLGIPALIFVVALIAWLFRSHQPGKSPPEFSGQSEEDEDVRK